MPAHPRPSTASRAVSFPASTSIRCRTYCGRTHMSGIPAASELAASSVSEGGIPPPIYLGRILWLCFFPVFTVVVGDFVLIFVAQAREALVAFNDQHAHSQLIAFAFAYSLWMVSAWYVARLLLGKRFKPDLIGKCSAPKFARDLAKRLPRAHTR